MKKILALLYIVFTVTGTYAQGFSGTIDFKYFTNKDTSDNVYVVKDKIVKLDQYTKRSKVIEGSFIFDLKNNKIKFVHPKRKIWGDHRSENSSVRGTCEVQKGSATKLIAGQKCKDYTVKNNDENTVITYWITENKFDFFIPTIKLWNRPDKQNIYFLQIKDLPAGSMPMMSEEKHISDGKIITRLEVIKISNKIPEDEKLDVPPGYTKFDQ